MVPRYSVYFQEFTTGFIRDVRRVCFLDGTSAAKWNKSDEHMHLRDFDVREGEDLSRCSLQIMGLLVIRRVMQESARTVDNRGHGASLS